MKNLFFRTISGIIYVSLIVFSLIFHKYSFFVLFVLLSSVMVLELTKGLNTIQKINVSKYSLIIFNVVFYTAFFFASSKGKPSYLFLALIPFLIIPLSELIKNNENPILNTTLAFFVIIYISLPFSLANTLFFDTGGSYSYEILLGLFILNWSNDTFAYIIGMLIGKHKLFERVSPKKSWEGFFGGAIFSIVTAFFLGKYFTSLTLQHWLALAVIVTVFGTIGDLIESMLKRQLKLKDIGNILPGHGGMLDRNDSFLFVVPAVCIYLQFIRILA